MPVCTFTVHLLTFHFVRQILKTYFSASTKCVSEREMCIWWRRVSFTSNVFRRVRKIAKKLRHVCPSVRME